MLPFSSFCLLLTRLHWLLSSTDECKLDKFLSRGHHVLLLPTEVGTCLSDEGRGGEKRVEI